MARAPKASKKSAAQIAAGQAFAAGGRAAAARHKAARGGKPTKAQHQAALKWAAAGRAAQKARRAGGRAVTPKSQAKRAAIATDLVVPESGWPTGCNDVAPTCASVAVAAHFRAHTGYEFSDAEIMRLHKLAGGDDGATIEAVLEALTCHWMTFSRGRARLLAFCRTDEQIIVAGLVVGVKLGHEGHAVLSAPGGMISWGQHMPWEGEPQEAWGLEWGF